MLIKRLLACAALCLTSVAHADPEIMLHENDVVAPGQWAGALHLNYTPDGDRTRQDGTWPTHHLGSAMAEVATGIAPEWEVGMHLPFMRAGVDSGHDHAGDWTLSALMFRVKHVHQTNEGLFWGFNAEYDINGKRFVADPNSVEFRTILGLDSEHYRLTANPHWMYWFGKSSSNPAPDFNVDWKALHKVSHDFAWGMELYSDWGKMDNLRPGDGDRTLYLVTEFQTRLGGLHLGIGRGYKDTPERQIVKLVWSQVF